MNAYVEPIITAFIVFPVLAFIITIPYLIYEYRKFGSILLLRTILVYSFVLYLLTSYFLVILPLPPRSLVAHYTSPKMQLHLGQFLIDIFSTTSIVWNQPATYLQFFKTSTVYTVLFNLFLTMPFGIYLRYYYQKKWYQVLLYSFCLSLFFEWTQLSGLYGIYPRSYRLFDVDDLLVNTIGGFLGFLVTPFFSRWLPSRDAMDSKAFQKGKKVSLFRRIFAYFIDFQILLLLVGIFALLFPSFATIDSLFLFYLIGVVFLFLLLPILFEGKTIGKWILRLRVTDEHGNIPKWYQILFRNLFLHVVFIPTPYYLFLLRSISISYKIKIFLNVILIINSFMYCLQFFLITFGKRERFGYEMISRTKEESTIIDNKG